MVACATHGLEIFRRGRRIVRNTARIYEKAKQLPMEAVLLLNRRHSSPVFRVFKGDRTTRIVGARIPVGTSVQVIKFLPRRELLPMPTTLVA